MNLRLARELNRGAEPLANAHWLMGAHRLAAGSHLEAVESFSSAAEQFRQADNRVCETMAAGYLGLAQMHSKQSRLEGKTALDAALRRLDEEGSENAEFFAAQLRTASEFFRNDAE